MEYITCTICGPQCKRSNEFNHGLTNRHLAADGEYFANNVKIFLADGKERLESKEHVNKKKIDIKKHVKKL